jgi:hypothetical protein
VLSDVEKVLKLILKGERKKDESEQGITEGLPLSGSSMAARR